MDKWTIQLCYGERLHFRWLRLYERVSLRCWDTIPVVMHWSNPWATGEPLLRLESACIPHSILLNRVTHPVQKLGTLSTHKVIAPPLSQARRKALELIRFRKGKARLNLLIVTERRRCAELIPFAELQTTETNNHMKWMNCRGAERWLRIRFQVIVDATLFWFWCSSHAFKNGEKYGYQCSSMLDTICG